jgi:ATP-dependent DNA helicase Rep
MLNPQQTAAINYISGPLLVLAGAGSGKTRVITEKIAYLIEHCGLRASSIYAVTFTNKAANEMKGRIAKIIPRSTRRGLKVATFHTLGLSIIKQNAVLCGLKSGFSIFDAEDCMQLLRGFFSKNKTSDHEYVLQAQQQISRWKNELLEPEQVTQNAIGDLQELIQVYALYQHALKAYNAVDFDDLIRLPVTLLSKQEEIRSKWQNKIRHLLVDEYQDSNACQYMLVKLLTGARANFTVVGDDDQSIYAWRGAKPENLALLQRDYPHLKVVKLEQNYRSTRRILQAANHLIAHNVHLFAKKLWSDLGPGDFLRVLVCKHEEDEAEQVVADLISHKLRHGTQYGDYAILYRGNHQSRIFEKIFRHHGIAYRISGGESWFARVEIKDIFAYIKLLCNPADDAAFLRAVNTPRRGIGEGSLSILGRYAQTKEQSLYDCADHLALGQQIPEKPRTALKIFKQWLEGIKLRLQTDSVVEVLRDMVDESGYEAHVHEQYDAPAKAQKRMGNVWELLEWVERLLAKNRDQQLVDVVNRLILIDVLEKSEEQDTHTIQLMTLHASKGLEFPYVYLVGMEEELLPHHACMEEDHIEEERRLAYVGMTRAKKGLCLSLAKQRRRGGELRDCQPSRFLNELPQDCLEWFGQLSVKDEAKSKALARSHLAGLKNLLETK